MNRLRLKVVGFAVLILVVIVGVWFLRPGESPPADQVEKQEETVSKPQANAHKPKTDTEPTAERAVLERASELENRKVAQLARTADSLKTLYRNPSTPEAAKARQSLLRLPEGLARSAPGGAAERERISSFLNRPALPQHPESPPNTGTRQRATAANPYSQPSADRRVENSTGSSRPALKDRLDAYKATFRELFPIHQSNLPTGLINRLPGPYRQQVVTSMTQRDLSLLPGVTPGTVSTRLTTSSKSYSARSGSGSARTAAKSFKSFSPNATRRSAASEPQSTTNSNPVGSR